MFLHICLYLKMVALGSYAWWVARSCQFPVVGADKQAHVLPWTDSRVSLPGAEYVGHGGKRECAQPV